MTAHGPEGKGGLSERFEYFMVRLTRSALESDRLAGLVERLGSGEKHSFDTGEQLVQLVSGGFALESNMQPGADGRNPVPTETTTTTPDGA